MNERPETTALTDLLSETVPTDTRQARRLARHQDIAEAVMAEGSLRIEDLADRFDISLMTAHRDLDELVARGLLRKARGTVSAAPTSLVEASDRYRQIQQAEEKAAIAVAAAALIEPGQAIFLDDSTTVQQMVPFLDDRVPLTVITNSLSLMGLLAEAPDVTLLGLGGKHHGWCNAFMGRTTVQDIGQLRADTLFLSMPAISDGVVFHQSAEMGETKRAMFDAARRRILLADHTKFERRALHAVAALDEFDVVITDDKLPAAHIEALRSRDLDLRIVSPEATPTS